MYTRARIDKEEVKRRMLEMEREDYEILEWNGTLKPCKLVCPRCKSIINLTKGSNAYSKDSKWFTFMCNTCGNNRLELGLKHIVESLDTLEKRVENSRVLREILIDLCNKKEPISKSGLVQKLKKIFNDERFGTSELERDYLSFMCEYKTLRKTGDDSSPLMYGIVSVLSHEIIEKEILDKKQKYESELVQINEKLELVNQYKKAKYYESTTKEGEEKINDSFERVIRIKLEELVNKYQKEITVEFNDREITVKPPAKRSITINSNDYEKVIEILKNAGLDFTL